MVKSVKMDYMTAAIPFSDVEINETFVWGNNLFKKIAVVYNYDGSTKYNVICLNKCCLMCLENQNRCYLVDVSPHFFVYDSLEAQTDD